jgi:hypothetical protein
VVGGAIPLGLAARLAAFDEQAEKRPRLEVAKAPLTWAFSEPPVGIEPTTYALRVRRSGRLS